MRNVISSGFQPGKAGRIAAAALLLAVAASAATAGPGRAGGAMTRGSVGDQECPRCKESFTISYWSDGSLIQAKCLSCEMKWPLPRVV